MEKPKSVLLVYFLFIISCLPNIAAEIIRYDGYITITISLVIFIVGVVVTYIKKKESYEPWNEHFLWQINTFWGSVLLVVVSCIVFITLGFLLKRSPEGLLSLLFGLYIICVAIGIWFIYRIIRGLIRYSKDKSPY